VLVVPAPAVDATRMAAASAFLALATTIPVASTEGVGEGAGSKGVV
jgi:hypothetical protein